MTTPLPRPTDRWLTTTATYMPPLTGPEGTAERLLLHIHYGLDWTNGWITGYIASYWDRILPDRIIAATYRTDRLRRWWREVTADLESAPSGPAARAEVEALLRAESQPVLDILRWETEPLLLRTRIVADAVRATKTTPPKVSA